jgi:hypothetical protein
VLAAAQAAAPFVHPRLSQREVRISTELGRKSDTELSARALLRRTLARTHIFA